MSKNNKDGYKNVGKQINPGPRPLGESMTIIKRSNKVQESDGEGHLDTENQKRIRDLVADRKSAHKQEMDGFKKKYDQHKENSPSAYKAGGEHALAMRSAGTLVGLHRLAHDHADDEGHYRALSHAIRSVNNEHEENVRAAQAAEKGTVMRRSDTPKLGKKWQGEALDHLDRYTRKIES